MSEQNEEVFQLPTAPSEPETNMKTCILFGKEKCGKTTAVASLPNCLVIDTEHGSHLVKSMNIKAPQDVGPVGRMQWLKKLASALVKDGVPVYDYVAIDTLSEVNEWSEWSGTYKYMMSPQGKKFNRKDGEIIEPDSLEYQSVHSLPDGNGYRWSRDEMLDIFKLFKNAAKKCVFFICHIEEKYVANKDTTDLVIPKQLALTGKIRDILPRKVDAIGYVYNKAGQIHVNFTGTEDKIGGNRAKHLLGYNGPLEWDKIFI